MSVQTHLVKVLYQLLHIERQMYVERAHNDMLDMRVRTDYPFGDRINRFLNGITKQAAGVMEKYLNDKVFDKNEHTLLSESKCSCPFSQQWFLPCRAVLASESASVEQLLSRSRWRKFSSVETTGNKENIAPVKPHAAYVSSTQREYVRHKSCTMGVQFQHTIAAG